jgi:hypothetical protein
MGIKFYCPNGHKVNVKSFLAGKKGLCPKCGVRVDIPLQSVAKNRSTAVFSAGNTTATGNGPEELLEQSSAGHAASTSPPTLSLLVEHPAIEQPSPASVSNLPRALPLNSTSSEVTLASPETSPDQTLLTDDLLLPPLSHSVVPQASAAPVWHVQSANGQRLGPLDNATLQQWIAVGRITPDDLVWHPGWPQWQSAQAALPQWTAATLHATPLPVNVAGLDRTAAPLAEAEQNSTPTASPHWLMQERHRGKRQIRARLSLVLLGLVVLLFALLLYIFVMRPQSSDQQPSEQKQTSRLTVPVGTALMDADAASTLA